MKSSLDAAANQIVIFDKENSHGGTLNWIANDSVAATATRLCLQV
jgi:hypothetical protein